MKSDNTKINCENRRAIDRYFRSKRFNNKKTKRKKQQYCRYLLEYSESIGKSIKKITYKDLPGFKKYMNNKTYRGKSLSPNTILNVYNEIHYFLKFLRHIKGYKRVITYPIVQFFKLSKSEKKRIRGKIKKKKHYPKLKQINEIIDIIPSDNILGRRLIALIIYLFLSGSRIESAATMRLGLVDTAERLVKQDPSKGVKTKFSKYIETTIPFFNEALYQIFVNWIIELKFLGFGNEDPLFPAAEKMKKKGCVQFCKSTDLSNQFLNPKTLSRLVKKACINADFGKFHSHSFRDSHIYYGLKSARNYLEVKAVSVNVGHKAISTTVGDYSDLAPEKVHELISELGVGTNSNEFPEEIKTKANELMRVLIKSNMINILT